MMLRVVITQCSFEKKLFSLLCLRRHAAIPEKCELLAQGVCPAGAFQPGGLRAHGSRFSTSMAQMVLIQSAYKLIAMSLYSLACGHFSQPVVQGCTCAWPADAHNRSSTSLLSQTAAHDAGLKPPASRTVLQLLHCPGVISCT